MSKVRNFLITDFDEEKRRKYRRIFDDDAYFFTLFLNILCMIDFFFKFLSHSL